MIYLFLNNIWQQQAVLNPLTTNRLPELRLQQKRKPEEFIWVLARTQRMWTFFYVSMLDSSSLWTGSENFAVGLMCNATRYSLPLIHFQWNFARDLSDHKQSSLLQRGWHRHVYHSQTTGSWRWAGSWLITNVTLPVHVPHISVAFTLHLRHNARVNWQSDKRLQATVKERGK